jgi:asparagine synthase (glutamine-hydrolysing)
MQSLADRYLGKRSIEEAGILDPKGVRELFALHAAPDTSRATRVQLDAVINHLIGVQILHRQFVASDLPRRAMEFAGRLGWAA